MFHHGIALTVQVHGWQMTADEPLEAPVTLLILKAVAPLNFGNG